MFQQKQGEGNVEGKMEGVLHGTPWKEFPRQKWEVSTWKEMADGLERCVYLVGISPGGLSFLC